MSDKISNDLTNEILTKRVRCDYTLEEQHLMKLRKEIVLKELEILQIKKNAKFLKIKK